MDPEELLILEDAAERLEALENRELRIYINDLMTKEPEYACWDDNTTAGFIAGYIFAKKGIIEQAEKLTSSEAVNTVLHEFEESLRGIVEALQRER